MRNRLGTTILLLALAAVAAGCGGNDKEAQAKKDVCTARADIAQQIKTLQDVSPSLKEAPQIRRSVSAMIKDLGKIRDARPNLDSKTKDQLKEADQRLKSEAESLGVAAVSGALAGDPAKEIKKAIDDVAKTYDEIFAPVSC